MSLSPHPPHPPPHHVVVVVGIIVVVVFVIVFVVIVVVVIVVAVIVVVFLVVIVVLVVAVVVVTVIVIVIVCIRPQVLSRRCALLSPALEVAWRRRWRELEGRSEVLCSETTMSKSLVTSLNLVDLAIPQCTLRGRVLLSPLEFIIRRL